jgi:hypothetical protein
LGLGVGAGARVGVRVSWQSDSKSDECLKLGRLLSERCCKMAATTAATASNIQSSCGSSGTSSAAELGAGVS